MSLDPSVRRKPHTGRAAETIRPVHSRISAKEFARRRRDLMALMEPDSIAIVPSANVQVRNRDNVFPFRQDSDFHYLSGFAEPEAVLVLLPRRQHGEFLLFCREREAERELWDGTRAGPEGACAEFGADDAFPIGDIDDILPGLLEGRQRVYYSLGKEPEFDRRLIAWINRIRGKVRAGAHPPGEFLDLDHLLHEQRLVKSKEELAVMEQAWRISVNAHRRAMRHCRPGMFEYQLEAEILHEFMSSGARHPAYSSIVGGGANACVLHYVDNSAALRSGDLVLIDAGCEFEHYAADVTRTFPVNGKFSRDQQAIYEVVLNAQLEAIREVKPGRHWHTPHDATVRVITQGLRDLGILDGETGELIETRAYRSFYMHRAGHWLGMDVHDVGDYKIGEQWRMLEAGMVLTVEPGIYIAPDNREVARKWRGIGIRIEDDVVVTAAGCKVATKGAPKGVADIEKLMVASR
jgi:Xaa-Pro aminopeptidase